MTTSNVPITLLLRRTAINSPSSYAEMTEVELRFELRETVKPPCGSLILFLRIPATGIVPGWSCILVDEKRRPGRPQGDVSPGCSCLCNQTPPKLPERDGAVEQRDEMSDTESRRLV